MENLAGELVFDIAERLEKKDVASFLLVSRRFAKLLSPLLYKQWQMKVEYHQTELNSIDLVHSQVEKFLQHKKDVRILEAWFGFWDNYYNIEKNSYRYDSDEDSEDEESEDEVDFSTVTGRNRDDFVGLQNRAALVKLNSSVCDFFDKFSNLTTLELFRHTMLTWDTLFDLVTNIVTSKQNLKVLIFKFCEVRGFFSAESLAAKMSKPRPAIVARLKTLVLNLNPEWDRDDKKPTYPPEFLLAAYFSEAASTLEELHIAIFYPHRQEFDGEQLATGERVLWNTPNLQTLTLLYDSVDVDLSMFTTSGLQNVKTLFLYWLGGSSWRQDYTLEQAAQDDYDEQLLGVMKQLPAMQTLRVMFNDDIDHCYARQVQLLRREWRFRCYEWAPELSNFTKAEIVAKNPHFYPLVTPAIELTAPFIDPGSDTESDESMPDSLDLYSQDGWFPLITSSDEEEGSDNTFFF